MSNMLPIIASLVIGLLSGALIVYLPRHRFIAAYAERLWLQRLSVVLDWMPAVLLAIVGTMFDLWKPATWTAEADTTLLSGFFFAAGCLGFSAAFKWFLTAAKDRQAAEIKELKGALALVNEQSAQREAQRDFLLYVQGQTAAIVRAKLDRLAAAREAVRKNPELRQVAVALAPRDQLLLLMKMVHEHFRRDLDTGKRLRAGVYARSDRDDNILEAVAAWDGERDGCFSNHHQKYMRLTNPGGARSLVVECYFSQRALLRVEDCMAASQENPPRFTFFSPEQRDTLKSMVAYRYTLRHAAEPSALVLTLDTDEAGFFSAVREFECQILFQETGQRIELELTSLELLNLTTTASEPKS